MKWMTVDSLLLKGAAASLQIIGSKGTGVEGTGKQMLELLTTVICSMSLPQVDEW